jgi:hypothetical protein
MKRFTKRRRAAILLVLAAAGRRHHGARPLPGRQGRHPHRRRQGADELVEGRAGEPADGPLNIWTYTWPDELGEVQMKPTLGEDKVSIGGAYKLAPAPRSTSTPSSARPSAS